MKTSRNWIAIVLDGGPRLLAMGSIIIALSLLGACERKAPDPPAPKKAEAPPTQPAAPAADPQPNPERNAYFGETHLHTSWSVDAWVMGNRVTGPGDAYKYAQGEAIKHPMGFEASTSKLTRRSTSWA